MPPEMAVRFIWIAIFVRWGTAHLIPVLNEGVWSRTPATLTLPLFILECEGK